jgi:hypothetical protein
MISKKNNKLLDFSRFYFNFLEVKKIKNVQKKINKTTINKIIKKKINELENNQSEEE